LAFEMARQVLAAGDRVATLSVIDLAAGLDSRRFGAAAAGSVPRNRFELNRRLAAPYLVAPIDCRVDYYRAMDSHRLDLSDPTGGWCHLALAGVRVLDLPGDHHTVVRGESRRRIAEAISAAIEGRADGVFHPPEPIHERVFAGIERARRSAIDGDLPAEIEALVSAIHVADGIGARLPAWVPANLAAARFDQGRVSEALTAYRSAMERSHSPLQVAARFASMLRRHRLEDPAREALRLATRTRIETVASATACATILLTFGRQPEAERVLRAGIGMIPQSLELRSLLVGLLAISGRNAELLSEAEQALALRSENEEVYGAIGRAAASAGGHAIALRCIERCLAINPMRRDIAAVVDRMRGRAG
jgi:hypothetical protein